MCVCFNLPGCLDCQRPLPLSLSLSLSFFLSLFVSCSMEFFCIFQHLSICNNPNMLFHSTHCASRVRFVSCRKIEADVTYISAWYVNQLQTNHFNGKMENITQWLTELYRCIKIFQRANHDRKRNLLCIFQDKTLWQKLYKALFKTKINEGKFLKFVFQRWAKGSLASSSAGRVGGPDSPYASKHTWRN